MPKPPKPETIAVELTVSERLLLFCFASRTDWAKAGVTSATAPKMAVKDFLERDHLTSRKLPLSLGVTH